MANGADAIRTDQDTAVRPANAASKAGPKAVLEVRCPLDGDELEAVTRLRDMARRWEGRMVERDVSAFRRRHVEQLPSGVVRLVSIHVEHRLPIGVAREQGRMVGNIGNDEQLARPSRHSKGCMPWRVTMGRDRRHAGREFLAGLVRLYVL